MWILQYWLLLSSTGEKKLIEAGADEGTDVGRMDKMMWRNDWKRNVYWKENRRRRNGKLMFLNLVFTAGRSSCLSFGGFWEFHLQFVVKLWCLDVSRHGLVCLKVTECFLIGEMDTRKEKGEEHGIRRAEGWWIIMYSQQQPAHIDLKSIRFTVFFQKNINKESALRGFRIERLWNQKCLTGDWCPFHEVRSLHVVVWRKEVT